jgi:hypothetical protein
MAESAFIVAVQEAESLVGELRDRYDPTSRLNVPAHITILYPFMPPDKIDDGIIRQASDVFSRYQPFDFSLVEIGRFPVTTYLSPDPSQPFIDLTSAVVREFPAFPPYEGKFESVIPHITVADGDAYEAARAEAELRALMGQDADIKATCDSILLIENSTGLWEKMHEFRLALIDSNN